MIRYIAALDLAQNQLHGRNRWRAIAATLGFDIRQYIGQPSFADIEAFIRGAAGLWLYNTAFLRDPNLSGSIHKAIEAG